MPDVKSWVLGPLQTNAYQIIDTKTNQSAVIDPGYPDETFYREVTADGAKIQWILLTHTHADHLLGAAGLQKMTGAVVYCHPLDLGALNDANKSLYTALEIYTVAQEPVDDVTPVADKDQISIGDTVLTVLHTPGHTPGSICFDSGELLFSGDTLFREGAGRTDLPGGDYAALLDSLTRLSSLSSDRRVYPGHGPATTLAHERKRNPWMGQNHDLFNAY